MKKSAPSPQKKKKAHVPQARNRTAIWRIYQLDALLREGKWPNAAYLARKLETSRRSIARDIMFLRDSLNLPVAFDFSRGGYYYTKEAPPLPPLQCTEGELFEFCIMGQMIESFRGTELEPRLRATFRKFTQGLDQELTLSWDAVAQVLSFRNTGVAAISAPDVFETLLRAAMNLEEVEFLYTNLGSTTPEHRRVEPFHLTWGSGIWYVWAYDPARDATRSFALPRLEELQCTGRTFEKGERHVAPDIQLQHSIGVFSGGSPERVRLKLNEIGARLLRERRYHPTQQITRVADDHYELTMDVAINPELERMIMSYCREAEVLEPASLRERIIENLRFMLARTGNEPGNE